MSDTPVARIARPAFLELPTVAAALDALPGSRAVGGAVRDALAGREVADVDVAAPLPPEHVIPRLRDAGLRVHETGLSHGTVTAVRDGVPVEVTSLRRDIATDGRHAVVEWTTDWREDASRRDFTINAMSLSAEGDLWDYFGGRADLAAGRVRFVGDPATRLAEDYLRALRWFRFHARYGRGEPDPAALAAIRDAAPHLPRLSAERIWGEMKRILAAPDPSDAVARMEGAGMLDALFGKDARFSPRHVAALTAVGAPPTRCCASRRCSGRARSGPRSAFVRRTMKRTCCVRGTGRGMPSTLRSPPSRRGPSGMTTCAGSSPRRARTPWPPRPGCGRPSTGPGGGRDLATRPGTPSAPGSRRCRCRSSRCGGAMPWHWASFRGRRWGASSRRSGPGGSRAAAWPTPRLAAPDWAT
ncbi:CCA tRNA nucleotidyltransferase [Roseomonas sp. CCTCC AB2023176]|uniref:CCA tRNA nucleotidyltransferase n=1 Tax=Roseomonas sp. CCTCC AB2023176 TaxID=3342640 RepID=UPI0035E16BDF